MLICWKPPSTLATQIWEALCVASFNGHLALFCRWKPSVCQLILTSNCQRTLVPRSLKRHSFLVNTLMYNRSCRLEWWPSNGEATETLMLLTQETDSGSGKRRLLAGQVVTKQVVKPCYGLMHHLFRQYNRAKSEILFLFYSQHSGYWFSFWMFCKIEFECE